jgi:LuxR family maltose regulon positive regulatory protein
LELAAERGKRLPASSAAHVGMGKLLREWNELGAATEHLKEGLELSEQGGNVEIVLDGHVALARTLRARGDWLGAADTLETAKRLARRHDIGAWVVRVKAWQARLCAAQNDRWAADRWLEECGLSVGDELSYPREFEHITFARVLIAQGAHDEAAELLERLLREAEVGGRGGRVVEILMLKALVSQARNDKSNAIAVLRRALTLAEPEGYVRIFADEGAPMTALLEQVPKAKKTQPSSGGHGVSPEYLGKLLAALLDSIAGRWSNRTAR